MDLEVDACSGYRADETPRRLLFGDRALRVLDVIDRWLGPDHRYFKLRCDDGGLYIVRHDMERDRWELVTYERAPAE